jgi:hypothetical protein
LQLENKFVANFLINFFGRNMASTRNQCCAQMPKCNCLSKEEKARAVAIFSQLETDTEIQVYWVDQKMWLPATVVLAWDAGSEGLFVDVSWPKIGALPEQLNLLDKTVLRRVRIPRLYKVLKDFKEQYTQCFACKYYYGNNDRCIVCQGMGLIQVPKGRCVECFHFFDAGESGTGKKCKPCHDQDVRRPIVIAEIGKAHKSDA